MSDPLVSIVMPLHHGEAFVREAVASVQAQTLRDWELLIVDDASQDRSLEIVSGLAVGDARIRIFALKTNVGSAVARNTALREARGRYVAFLDCDDQWLPHKLERQVRFMRESGAALSYAAYHQINAAGDRIGSVGVPARVTYGDLLKTCYIGCLTAMYDCRAFGEVAFPLARRRQDWALWLRLLRQVEYAHGIREPLALYRLRPDSVSGNKLTTPVYTWRMYRDLEGLSWSRSAHSFAHYAVRGVLRRRFPRLARRLGVLHPAKGSDDG